MTGEGTPPPLCETACKEVSGPPLVPVTSCRIVKAFVRPRGAVWEMGFLVGRERARALKSVRKRTAYSRRADGGGYFPDSPLAQRSNGPRGESSASRSTSSAQAKFSDL